MRRARLPAASGPRPHAAASPAMAAKARAAAIASSRVVLIETCCWKSPWPIDGAAARQSAGCGVGVLVALAFRRRGVPTARRDTGIRDGIGVHTGRRLGISLCAALVAHDAIDFLSDPGRRPNQWPRRPEASRHECLIRRRCRSGPRQGRLSYGQDRDARQQSRPRRLLGFGAWRLSWLCLRRDEKNPGQQDGSSRELQKIYLSASRLGRKIYLRDITK